MSSASDAPDQGLDNMGLGMGGSMMPVFSGATQTLRRAAVARASTSLNILQQVGASIGTAVMAVARSAEEDAVPMMMG